MNAIEYSVKNYRHMFVQYFFNDELCACVTRELFGQFLWDKRQNDSKRKLFLGNSLQRPIVQSVAKASNFVPPVEFLEVGHR